MRAEIHHGQNKDCPSVTLEGATHCPGHWVEVPETLDESVLKLVRTTVEYGWKARDRGESLMDAIAYAMKNWGP